MLDASGSSLDGECRMQDAERWNRVSDAHLVGEGAHSAHPGEGFGVELKQRGLHGHVVRRLPVRDNHTQSQERNKKPHKTNVKCECGKRSQSVTTQTERVSMRDNTRAMVEYGPD